MPFTPLDLTEDEAYVLHHTWHLGLHVIADMINAEDSSEQKLFHAKHLASALKTLSKNGFASFEAKLNTYFVQYAEASGQMMNNTDFNRSSPRWN